METFKLNNNNIDFDNFDNKDIIKIIDEYNFNKNIKPKKKFIISRERQLKINAASRRSRIKNKMNFNSMKTHIDNLHKLIKDSNIQDSKINNEINNFNNIYMP